MSVSLAVEQLHHTRLHGDDPAGLRSANDAPSRVAPRRTRSNKSERAKEIRRQLKESAMAELQMTIDAQDASATVVPQQRRTASTRLEKETIDKENKRHTRSKSPYHHPDRLASFVSMEPPKRTTSLLPNTASRMQSNLEPSLVDATVRERATPSSDTNLPPRSRSKVPLKLRQNETMISPINTTRADLPLGAKADDVTTTAACAVEDTISLPESITVARAPPPLERLESTETETTKQNRASRTERREERRERKSRTTSQKRSRSKSSSRHNKLKSHCQLAKSGGNGVISNCNTVDTTSSGGSVHLDSQPNQPQDMEQPHSRDRTTSYPSPKEEPAKKGDSPPAPPRKAPESPPNEEQPVEKSRGELLGEGRAQGHLQEGETPITSQQPPLHHVEESSRSAFVPSTSTPGGRWESDTMLQLELVSHAVPSHPGIVVSTSTRRKSRPPSRTSSINSNATEATIPMSNPPSRGYVSKRRIHGSFSESTMTLNDSSPESNVLTSPPAEPTESVVRPVKAHTTSASFPAPVSKSSRETYTPPLSPFFRSHLPRRAVSAERRPPMASPTKQQQQEQQQQQQQAKPQRGRKIISGIRKSFSFSSGKKSNDGKDDAGSALVKGKEGKKNSDWENSPALAKFLKRTPNHHMHPPPSPANTERTGRTVSTASTEQSDVSNLSCFNDSPVPSRHGMVRNMDHVRDGTTTTAAESNQSMRLFNLSRLRGEFDKPRVGLEQDRIVDDVGQHQRHPLGPGRMIDPHILIQAASVAVDPDSMLAAHFQKARRRAELKARAPTQPMDDEASDIVSTAQNDARSTPGRSKSTSSASGRSTTQNDKKHHKRNLTLTVSFDRVMIREYERCVGDNPAVSSGPPIGLGWNYMQARECSVDFFETSMRAPPPRTRKDFFLPAQKRFYILLDQWGFSVQDICRAKDEASEIRYQRQVSVLGNPELQMQVTQKAEVVAAAAAAAFKKKEKKSGISSKSNNTNRTTPQPMSIPLVSPIPSKDRWATSSVTANNYPLAPLDVTA
jgi:hypothetical protein